MYTDYCYYRHKMCACVCVNFSFFFFIKYTHICHAPCHLTIKKNKSEKERAVCLFACLLYIFIYLCVCFVFVIQNALALLSQAWLAPDQNRIYLFFAHKFMENYRNAYWQTFFLEIMSHLGVWEKILFNENSKSLNTMIPVRVIYS